MTATGDISVLHRGQWTARPTSPGGIHPGGGAGTGGAIEGADIGGGGGGGIRAEISGGLGAASVACGTVAPQLRQKRIPASAGVPHLGQAATFR